MERYINELTVQRHTRNTQRKYAERKVIHDLNLKNSSNYYLETSKITIFCSYSKNSTPNAKSEYFYGLKK